MVQNQPRGLYRIYAGFKMHVHQNIESGSQQMAAAACRIKDSPLLRSTHGAREFLYVGTPVIIGPAADKNGFRVNSGP
ncbi:hypothetical protein D3C80_1928450 [compost metagenome]